MTPYDQARTWLDKQEPAISGSNGHGQTFHVACVLVRGFGLGQGDVGALLSQYNLRCSPPWSDRELDHKVLQAMIEPDSQPVGYMLRGSWTGEDAMKRHQRKATAPTALRPRQAAKIESIKPMALPDPLPDGARALLRATFREGEGVRIANAALNDDGREVPANEGPCLSREEWLRKLDAKDGQPNKIWSSSKKTGIYITINPMRVGGSKDADVSSYRHALVEFDSISREEQWALYSSTNLPCSAIISSGGKSIHAWVRVDAKDRAEYDERVRMLYAHFADSGYALDTKNKNPSRFSRLPNCIRFGSRQELLALNTGAPSFTEWLKERANADLKACQKLPELIHMNTTADPNCVIGFRDGRTLRYLCKGKAAWLIGPSGIGKSSLLAQFAIAWAQGDPAFGITPARPLKSLIIQAENDEMDLAEMVQGILPKYEELEFDVLDSINKNILFYNETTAIGDEFNSILHRLIDRERPDVVWCDPLLSFAGIDVSKQEQVSHFLRQQIQKTLESTGVVMIGLHHTGKPKFAKESDKWTAIDWAYQGIGSSELVNWARAVMVLHPHGDGQFELKLAKRGSRAGAKHPNNDWASSVWIRHASKGISWEQVNPPEEPAESDAKADRKQSIPQRIAAANCAAFLAGCLPEGETHAEIKSRLRDWAGKELKIETSSSTWDNAVQALLNREKLIKDKSEKPYKKGPKA